MIGAVRSTFDDPPGIHFCGKRLSVEGVEVQPDWRPLPLERPAPTPEQVTEAQRTGVGCD
jgi:hypothetical protein